MIIKLEIVQKKQNQVGLKSIIWLTIICFLIEFIHCTYATKENKNFYETNSNEQSQLTSQELKDFLLVYDENYQRPTNNLDNEYSSETEEEIDDHMNSTIEDLFVLKQVITQDDLLMLRQSLLRYYDKNSRPLLNSSHSIEVQIAMNLIQINELDEEFQTMTSTLQISLTWFDQIINWNYSIYSNPILFKSSEIWTPDVITSNNVNNIKYDSKETIIINYGNSIFDFSERNKYMIRCKSTGECNWSFPMKSMTMCQLNQEQFPYDIQNCHLKFSSSSFYSNQLTLKKFGSGVFLNFINEGEFELINTEVLELDVNKIADLNTSVVELHLTMKRKTIYYFNKIILPYLLFYVVTMFTYILPVDSGEKKSYLTSILLSGMIYLKDISGYIPKTITLPILSIYFNLNLIFVFICTIFTTVVYLIYYFDKTKRPMPWCLRKLILKSKISVYKNIYDKLLHRKPMDFQINDDLKTRVEVKDSIKKQLVTINNQLLSLNNLIESKETNNILSNANKLSPRYNQRREFLTMNNPNSLEYFAHDILCLLRTFKSQIMRNCVQKLENTSHGYFIQSQSQSKFGVQEDSLTTEWFDKQEKLSNLQYVNTLENIKLFLMKKTKIRKSKSLNRISSQSQGCFLSQHNRLRRGTELLLVESGYKSESERSVLETRKAMSFLRTIRMYNQHLTSYLEIRKLKEQKYSKIINLIDAPYSNEWKYLAVVLDKILFYTFVFIIPVSILTMSLKTIVVS